MWKKKESRTRSVVDNNNDDAEGLEMGRLSDGEMDRVSIRIVYKFI